MKRIALGLLALAALLYAAATALAPRHAAWGYVAAFAEAAMVGAIADWFAVVALFRRPLGLPIPHTAIIPTNKSRIGENLARFICSNFLGTPQVLAKVDEFDPAARLADWLAVPANAGRVGEHLAAAARYGLGVFDDERVRRFVRETLVARLEQVDVSRVAGQLLDVLTAQGRHQAMLDEVLQQLAATLEDEATTARIADIAAADMTLLRRFGLDAVAGRLAAQRIVSGVGRMIGEMSADPAHPLRLRFDGVVAEFVAKLKEDPAFRLKGEQIRDEALAHPALAAYLHELWTQLIEWLRDDLAQPESTIRARVTAAALTLGERLRGDAAMRAWINAQVVEAAPRWIERYREDIRRYIVERVERWNTEEMTVELERNIGRDLQFIRVNGTVVGGLVGLAIHAVTRGLGGA